MRPERPALLWSEDRLHLGPLGHRAVAMEVLHGLGVPHGLDLSGPAGALGVRRSPPASERASAAVSHAAP